MVESDIKATYLELVQFIPGLKCPKCGIAFITEKVVVEVVTPGEEEIEAKL